MFDQEGEVLTGRTRMPVKPKSAGPESARPASADSWPLKPGTVSVGPMSAIRIGSEPTGPTEQESSESAGPARD